MNGPNTAQFIGSAPFGSTVTVTVGAPVPAAAVSLGVGYALSGTSANPLTLVGAANLTGSGAVGAVIAGSAGLNVQGSLTLNGAESSTYTGTTRASSGILTLDFTNHPTGVNLINPASALRLDVASVTVQGGSVSKPASQAFAGLTFGGTNVVVTANGAGNTLDLGPLTRVGGALVQFFPDSSGGGVIRTTTANTAGTILGGFATYNSPAGLTWAVTGTGGGTYAVTGLATYQAAWGAGNDTDVPAAGLTGVGATNSLRFNPGFGATPVVTLTGPSSVTSGGVLATGAYQITGGSLTSGPGTELIFHANGIGFGESVPTVSSPIVDNGGAVPVIKAGFGTLALGGANTYTGPTAVVNGTLKLVGSGSFANSPTITVGGPGGFGVLDVTPGAGGLTGGGELSRRHGAVHARPGADGPGDRVDHRGNHRRPGGAIWAGTGGGAASTLSVGGGPLTFVGDAAGGGALVVDLNGYAPGFAPPGFPLPLLASQVFVSGDAWNVVGPGPMTIRLLGDQNLIAGQTYQFTLGSAGASAGGTPVPLFQRNGVAVTSYAYGTDFVVVSDNYAGFEG